MQYRNKYIVFTKKVNLFKWLISQKTLGLSITFLHQAELFEFVDVGIFYRQKYNNLNDLLGKFQIDSCQMIVFNILISQ